MQQKNIGIPVVEVCALSGSGLTVKNSDGFKDIGGIRGTFPCAERVAYLRTGSRADAIVADGEKAQSAFSPEIRDELRRRHVVQVALFSGAFAWVVIQVGMFCSTAFALSYLQRYLVAALVCAFPVVLLLSWLFDITPGGHRAH